MTEPLASARCAALVLAAGRSTRFGSDKRTAALANGQSVLASTLKEVQAYFDPVYVVLRCDDDPQTLGIDAQVHIVRAEQAADGMGASLAAGITALANVDAPAVAVLLGDMPWIAPQTFEQLLGHLAAPRILLPRYQGRRGHPVIFGRHFWADLTRLQGDQGGRLVIEANPHACLVLDLDDPGILRDIDTPADIPA
ncbi:TPA: NTP transferase domain-containing protein [Pseudomonas putida]